MSDPHAPGAESTTSGLKIATTEANILVRDFGAPLRDFPFIVVSLDMLLALYRLSFRLGRVGT